MCGRCEERERERERERVGRTLDLGSEADERDLDLPEIPNRFSLSLSFSLFSSPLCSRFVRPT